MRQVQDLHPYVQHCEKKVRLNHVSMIERRVKKENSQSMSTETKNKPFNYLENVDTN